MNMYIYGSTARNYMGQLTPIVVESNLAYAIPYWTKRKLENPKLFWEIK
jgi:hypothetical protein